MRKLKKTFILLALIVFTSFTILKFIPKVDASATKTMYNLVCFIYFNDETDDINNTVSYGETRRKVIDNSYNGEGYSINDYYRSLSSGKVNLKTVYLYASATEFTSFKMSKDRECYAAKSDTNPNGYTSMGEAQSLFVNEWTALIQEAIDKNILPCAYNDRSDTINYSDLDSNGDGIIDLITLIFSPQTQTNFTSTRQEPLYPCMAENSNIKIKTNGKTLTSKTYNQWVSSYSSLYRAKDSNNYFMPLGTSAHEMGHCFGYRDLYCYNQQYFPVGNMSLMSDLVSVIPQYMTGYEREVNGWINEENVS